MALATMIKKLNKAREDYNKQLKELGASAADAVAEFLAEKIPEGFAIGWSQYTPYFADGEACEFSVNEPCVFAVSAVEDDEQIVTDTYEALGASIGLSKWSIERYLKAPDAPGYGTPKIEGLTKTALTELLKAWEELPEDMMKAAFGDHTQVRVNADGTYTTNDYDHD